MTNLLVTKRDLIHLTATSLVPAAFAPAVFTPAALAEENKKDGQSDTTVKIRKNNKKSLRRRT